MHSEYDSKPINKVINDTSYMYVYKRKRHWLRINVQRLYYFPDILCNERTTRF